MSHVVSIVLNIAQDKAEEFEAKFREHELPIWKDMIARGEFQRAALTPCSISSMDPGGVAQYLLTIFLKDAGAHSAHDSDPRFEAWNKIADAYQPIEPYVFGGDPVIELGAP
jgi:hypothetical protein